MGLNPHVKYMFFIHLFASLTERYFFCLHRDEGTMATSLLPLYIPL